MVYRWLRYLWLLLQMWLLPLWLLHLWLLPLWLLPLWLLPLWLLPMWLLTDDVEDVHGGLGELLKALLDTKNLWTLAALARNHSTGS